MILARIVVANLLIKKLVVVLNKPGGFVNVGIKVRHD